MTLFITWVQVNNFDIYTIVEINNYIMEGDSPISLTVGAGSYRQARGGE